MTTKQVILTSGTSWTVPADWNNASNTIECIGAGAGHTDPGAGAGAYYAKISNLSLTPGASVSYAVGASGTSTWFGSTTTVYAPGGNSGSPVGDVYHAGGAPNIGGGGAGGPYGEGASGSSASGGSADNGHGGAGGTSTSTSPNGADGTEWGTVGSGGGGYGHASGNGGNYGGGGGGPSGSGAPGVIVITYTPAASPISGSASLSLGGSGTLVGVLPASGSAGLTLAASGTLRDAAPPGHISGSASLQLAAHGTLTAVPHIAPLAGAVSLALGGSGTLVSHGALAGHASLTFGAFGKLSAVGPLHGSATLALGGSGTLRNANAGAHFYQLFVNVYTARQTLLNAIYAASKADADTANTQLAAIASDNILSPGEKSVVIRDYNALIAEQSGIDAQAASNGLSTSTYDSALSALTAYLATLTTPKAWNDKSGNTTIVGATFRANFAAVYAARQALLNSMDAAFIITNPNFVNGLAGWTNSGSGWSAGSGSTQNPYITSYAQFSGGSTNAQLFNNSGQPCQPGDTFACSAQITGVSGTGGAKAGVAFFQSNGTLAAAYWGNNLTGSASGTSRVVATAPANAVSANAAISVGNYTGTGSFQFSGVTLDAMPNSIDEVADGTTYAKILGSDLSNGTHKIGVAGSGYTVGDQRNLNPITWAGVRSTQSTSPLAVSYDTAAPANLSFTCSAVSFTGGGYTTSYNSSSASTTQTRGTGPVTYYFYYRDAINAGGAKTLQFTTNQSDLSAYPDIVYLGLITIAIPASGSGSGSQGGAGGGAAGLPAR